MRNDFIIEVVLHPIQNEQVLFSFKLSATFWKMIYVSYSKLSKDSKNCILISVGQPVLELLITFFYCFDPLDLLKLLSIFVCRKLCSERDCLIAHSVLYVCVCSMYVVSSVGKSIMHVCIKNCLWILLHKILFSFFNSPTWRFTS